MQNPRVELFEIAESQQGYFTFQQAINAGFSEKNHAYHVRSCDWIKAFRGIYRLARYPLGDREELVVWFLWSRNHLDEPQGVYSHYTALDLYELSDYMPSKLHMIVPKGFRRTAKIPQILTLYKRELHPDDIVMRQGYKITTPLRSLIDVVEEGTLADELIVQAVHDARKKGLITKHGVETNKRFAAKTLAKLLEIMERDR